VALWEELLQLRAIRFLSVLAMTIIQKLDAKLSENLNAKMLEQQAKPN